jgi:hypothetical protein
MEKEGKKGDQINALTSLSSNGDGTERDDSVDIDSSSEGDEGESDTFKCSVSACEHFRGEILKCLNQAKLLTQVSALGAGMGMGLSGVTGKVSIEVLYDPLYDLFALYSPCPPHPLLSRPLPLPFFISAFLTTCLVPYLLLSSFLFHSFLSSVLFFCHLYFYLFPSFVSFLPYYLILSSFPFHPSSLSPPLLSTPSFSPPPGDRPSRDSSGLWT